MSGPTSTVTVARPRIAFRAETSVLLIVAALAWLTTIIIARDMGIMPGTMGLGFVGFIGVWTLMMAAMMLPSIAPFATLYATTMRNHRARRVLLLAVGYLAVWAGAGAVGFAAAAAADRLAADVPGWAQATAIASCIVCGVYQLTPLKERCLQHCRSPLGHLLHYTSLRGPFADVRVGFGHGAWCLACCWSLMLLLVTFGVMNVFAMAALAAVIVVEKVFAPGRWFSTAVGIAAFCLAIAIWLDPSLAVGLHPTSQMMMGEM
jgi:predicted metal-binding membrane protein